MEAYTLYTDGATRPTNPGPSGYGAALYAGDDLAVKTHGFLGENFSNNQAEYAGVLAGLHLVRSCALPFGTLLVVKSDSNLIIKQVTGKWALRAAKLGPLHAAVRRVIGDIENSGVTVSFEHVRGHAGIVGNELVDSLATTAVMTRAPAPAAILAVLDQSHDKASVAQKGHEKLAILVKEHFGKRFTVLDVAPEIPISQRTFIHLQNTMSGKLLLQFPQLAITSRHYTALVALATGFKRVRNGLPAVPTMDESAFAVAKALGAVGSKVLVVHRPHATDHWMTMRELGWSSDDEVAPAVYLSIHELCAGKRFSQDGWPPFVELINTLPWMTIDSD